ncbi:MAG: hypothetical protein L0Y80_08705 [Ignavibacteriae bacterium]|nr:hypothetical protein [Ignavibacteriota bacterium]
MRFTAVTIVVLLCALFLTGCFEVETVIHVKRDGSGTVHERIVLKSDMMIMMITMAKMNDEGAERNRGKGLFNEQELREKASAMGEGVRYTSSKIFTGDEGEGYEATYTFRDVNTLRVSMTPDLQPEAMKTGEEGEGQEEEDQELRFEFRKGSPATLVVYVPPVDRNNDQDSTEQQTDEESEEGLQMARTMLKDLRISAVVEVEGTVVESDATFRDKSKITLTDIDFDKLTEDENLIRTAMKSRNLSDEEAKELMKKYPGLKIELNRKTTVRFK